MRLSRNDSNTIRDIIIGYDPQAVVKLFGSQACDEALGGDIDLLVFSSRIGLSERIQIETDLQDALGLRRFDIVVAPHDQTGVFVQLANRGAVTL